MKKWIKIVIWIVFWTMSYFVLLGIFASASEWLAVDVIYTAIFILTLMGACWINIYLWRKPDIRAFAASICIITWAAYMNQMLFEKVIDYILPGFYFISYYSYFDLVKFYSAFIGLTTLIRLSIEWFELQDDRRKLAILEKEKISAEFKALVSQVNPHFLFNGLTVVYSLSLKDSKETSSAIIKLSDILRYVIYQSSENTVKLSSEAAILRDYIDLQRYRVHPSTKIEFEDYISRDVSVSPMMFLPLLENAFKHGVHSETENAFVSISLREEHGVVTFTIANNKSSVKTEPGIGLKNLKERLQMIYPDRHTFVVSETPNIFNVNMQISL